MDSVIIISEMQWRGHDLIIVRFRDVVGGENYDKPIKLLPWSRLRNKYR